MPVPEATTPTDPSALALTKVQAETEERLARQGAGSAAAAFVREVSTSLLFQYDWGQLLSAAPMCIYLMGSCYVAATSPSASGTMINRPTFGTFSKVGPEVSLRECLLKVSDEGGAAFQIAEKKMELIRAGSEDISGAMTSAGALLSSLPDAAAESNLDAKLTLILDTSNDCLQHARTMEESFVDWLKLVCAIHQAAAAKEEDTSVERQKATEELLKLAFDKTAKSQSLQMASDHADLMKKNMDKSQQMFEKAADAIPGPLAQVGLQMVAGLAQAATTTISQALPTIIGGLIAGPGGAVAGARGSAAAGAGSKEGEATSGKGGGLRRRFRDITSQLKVKAVDPDDPAYGAANRVEVGVNLLVTLTGADATTGIKWDQLATAAGATAQTGTESLAAAASIIGIVANDTTWSNGTASTELKASLKELQRVIDELKTEMGKTKSLNNSRPAADSPKVKGWQSTVMAGKATVLKLMTAAASLPGGSPNAPPPINVTPSPPSAPGADPTGMQAALKSAQDKLTVTEAAYENSLNNFQKATENKIRLDGELKAIESSLEKLKLSQANLEEIKAVLRQCIGILIQMKEQISNLVNFFTALSAMVERVVKTKVRDFLNQVKVAKDCRIGNVSLSDMIRRDLYTTTLVTQAYFSLFANIAKLYCEVSVEHVKPGLVLCNQMSQEGDNKDAMQDRMRKLDQFTKGARQAVADKVTTAQKKITAGLTSRVDSIKDQTKLLPPPPPATLQAISSGAEVVAAATTKAIESQVSPIMAASTGVTLGEDDY